jgi:membrane-associated phospholipid phosphatase
MATTLGDAVGSRWARAGLYTLAAGTAWARMAQEKHWLSDVVAGAAVGILSARLANGRMTVTQRGVAMRLAF